MKQKSWLSSLIALAVFVTCVIACTGARVSTIKSSGNNNSATPAATPTVDLAGQYTVAGTNENGSPYKGELEVISHGDVYQFRWKAGPQYDGIGIPNGGVVAVAFTQGANGKGCGVVSYQILADGTLDGAWGYWGVNERGTERAQRTSGSDVAGGQHNNPKKTQGKHQPRTLVGGAQTRRLSFSLLKQQF